MNILHLLLKIIFLISIVFSNNHTEELTNDRNDAGDVGTDGYTTTTGGFDGGFDGGLTDGGAVDIPGCTDSCAYNHNPEASIEDFSCIYTDCNCLNSSIILQNYYYNTIYACYELSLTGETCEQISSWGFDCSFVEECNLCYDGSNNNECNEGFVDDCSGDGDCCEESWIGDGYGDCENQEWGCDLSCYDNDGGDCSEQPTECSDTDCWTYLNQGYDCDTIIGYGYDCSLCLESGDCDTHLPELNIDLTLDYPTDYAHIHDYENVLVQWSYNPELVSDNTDIYISILLSYNYGGGLFEVARNINILNQYAEINLSTSSSGNSLCPDNDINCIETIFGSLVIVASDSQGNEETSECSNIILGNPNGDIGIEWIDEEDQYITINWGWLENQDIIIKKQAFETLNDYAELKIIDNYGINSNDCGNEYGAIELLSIDPRLYSTTETFTLNCGFDYCDENGDRILGYLYGNEIYFLIGDGTGSFSNISPILTDDSHSGYFLNNLIIIEDFEINSTSNNYSLENLIQEDRDYDAFNVYNKVNATRDECEFISGCTDITATNYNNIAELLDCSCYYYNNDGYGCIDSLAMNYNPDAENSDGSCIYLDDCIVGCMDETACNYDDTSIVDFDCLYDNECSYGCTDTDACNYDPDADIDDGSCGAVLPSDHPTNPNWCFLETIEGYHHYQDRIQVFQESIVKYRIWLLNDENEEILKTFDTEGLETFCLETDCDGELGGDATIDECGICDNDLLNDCDNCSEGMLNCCPIVDNYGNVNDDLIINVLDIVVAVAHIMGDLSLIGLDFCRGDMNDDFTINVVDIVQIIAIVLRVN